jgi:hypothetical protein
MRRAFSPPSSCYGTASRRRSRLRAVNPEWTALETLLAKEKRMTSRRSTLTTWLATAFALAVTVSVASAQNWYYINRQPATPSLAQFMAARGLPVGYYWLRSNGDWGIEGNPNVLGNINQGSGRSRGSPNDPEPGWNRRTPGGDLLSDGKCSFVLGIPVGNC